MISSSPEARAPSSAMISAAAKLGATVTPAGAKPGRRETTMLRRPSSGLPIVSKVFRPMITGLPMVSRRKRFMSLDSRQGMPVPAPITPFSATAAIRETMHALRVR